MDHKTKRPKRPKIFNKNEDVWIKRFGPGKLFNRKHRDARILANAWKGCTQASMHATINTAHPPEDPKVLAGALAIVIKHLETNLYEPNKHLYESGFSLWEVVHDQEERNRFLLTTGTGFFITEDGYLISNYHVVKDAAKVRLLTSAGLIDAKVVQVDAANDLALLKADGKFSPLPISSSRSAQLGGTVATVGFPDIGLQGFAPKCWPTGEIASRTSTRGMTRGIFKSARRCSRAIRAGRWWMSGAT